VLIAVFNSEYFAIHRAWQFCCWT